MTILEEINVQMFKHRQSDILVIEDPILHDEKLKGLFLDALATGKSAVLHKFPNRFIPVVSEAGWLYFWERDIEHYVNIPPEPREERKRG